MRTVGPSSALEPAGPTDRLAAFSAFPTVRNGAAAICDSSTVVEYSQIDEAQEKIIDLGLGDDGMARVSTAAARSAVKGGHSRCDGTASRRGLSCCHRYADGRGEVRSTTGHRHEFAVRRDTTRTKAYSGTGAGGPQPWHGRRDFQGCGLLSRAPTIWRASGTQRCLHICHKSGPDPLYEAVDGLVRRSIARAATSPSESLNVVARFHLIRSLQGGVGDLRRKV